VTDAELKKRLQKLERDNHRLKVLALIALFVPAMLLIMAEVRPSGTITANKFVLMDRQGTTRAVLRVGPLLGDGVSLTFLDAEGRKRVELGGGTGPVENSFGFLKLGEDAASERYVLTSTGGHGGVTLSDGGLVMRAYPPSRKAGSVLLEGPGSSGPVLELTDSKGFMMDLGSTGLATARTGATEQTSAASIVMFGNDKEHQVIWRAP
jgi:hypothetical protein